MIWLRNRNGERQLVSEHASVEVADAFWRKVLARIGGDDGHTQSEFTSENWSPAAPAAFPIALTGRRDGLQRTR